MDDEDDFTDLGFDREELENPTYNQPPDRHGTVVPMVLEWRTSLLEGR
jgi:hypothetical protein